MIGWFGIHGIGSVFHLLRLGVDRVRNSIAWQPHRAPDKRVCGGRRAMTIALNVGVVIDMA
jgi:hypothetical protein